MPKPLVEDLPRLDTLDLKPIHGDQPMSGTATWIDGSPLNLEFDPDAPSVRIRWGTLESRSSQLIQLANSRPNYGGMRRWFICPETGKKARILYFCRGSWASRQAIGAAYLSQRQTDADRYATQSEKVLRRLGSPDGRTEPDKPKWMHWSTYDRELTRAIEYSDASWAFSVVKVLSMA